MNNSAITKALQPLATRMSCVVHEHEILRVAATIQGQDPAKAAEAARREILHWAQKRSGGRLPKDAWNFQGFEYFSGGRNSLGVRIKNSASDIWAIRAEDPDKTVPGRIWTTEVVVGVMAEQPPRFSARLFVSTSENELNIEPHTPGFIQQVVENCGLSCGPRELNAEPWLVESDDDAEHLINFLIDPDRALPTFVLTVPDNSTDLNRPLINAEELARATLGIGHVVILPSAFTWALSDRFGRRRSVFGGAVRVYHPGFSEDADPYSHRLVLGDQISTLDGPAQCTRWIKSLAASESIRRTRVGNDILAFSAIRNAVLEYKQQRLKEEGANDSEQLEAANERINALEKQVQDEKAMQVFFADENEKSEQRAEAAEKQAIASAFRIQQLLEQLKVRGESPDTNIVLPNTWLDFDNWCDENLAGRVVLSPPARRGVRSPEFEDVEVAARCLLWLANECRDRRINGGEGSLREEVVLEGFRNTHCGNDQYDLNWQDQRFTADWHIKSGGNTRDPKRCLRIYYFWDSTTQQIVIADMPAHRRTGAS